MTNRLHNKIALITGAARGIGAATARLFAQEGAQVILSDIDDAEGKKMAAELGEPASFLHLDVAQEDEWQKVSQAIQSRYGSLDILVNNAGIIGFDEGFGPQDPEHCSLHDWQRIHRINADGVFLGCKYAIQLMKQQKKGSIVNLSSRSGMVGIPGAAPYASSKASIRNHTKTVALYCAQQAYDIRCNSVHPAAILTPMWNAVLGTGAQREATIQKMAQDIPLKRLGKPEEVASIILYLASDESSYVTGAEFTIDGGILAGSTAAPKK